MARHAAAGRQGLAQGVFQVGGHMGYSIGPLLAAAVVMPRGQESLSWFSGVVLVAMLVMGWLGALADQVGIIQVFKLCAWLPALGLLTFLLPRSVKRL